MSDNLNNKYLLIHLRIIDGEREFVFAHQSNDMDYDPLEICYRNAVLIKASEGYEKNGMKLGERYHVWTNQFGGRFQQAKDQ